MLGSAWVEYRIGSAAALSADRVYAGEAALDLEALLGRVERIDPRTPSFGATLIGADGDPARGLRAVTGHEPILHSSYNDDPASKAWTKYADPGERDRLYQEHMRSFGYLDTGTDSLENAARASTGASPALGSRQLTGGLQNAIRESMPAPRGAARPAGVGLLQ